MNHHGNTPTSHPVNVQLIELKKEITHIINPPKFVPSWEYMLHPLYKTKPASTSTSTIKSCYANTNKENIFLYKMVFPGPSYDLALVEVYGRLVVKDILRARIDELGYAPRPYVGDILIGVNKMILPLSMDFQRALTILRKAKVEEGRAGMSASSKGVELIFCEYPGFVKEFEEEIVSQISERIDQRSTNICENFMQSSSNNSSSAKPPEFSMPPANQISESIDQRLTNICENFIQYSSNNSSSANRKNRHTKPPKFPMPAVLASPHYENTTVSFSKNSSTTNKINRSNNITNTVNTDNNTPQSHPPNNHSGTCFPRVLALTQITLGEKLITHRCSIEIMMDCNEKQQKPYLQLAWIEYTTKKAAEKTSITIDLSAITRREINYFTDATNSFMVFDTKYGESDDLYKYRKYYDQSSFGKKWIIIEPRSAKRFRSLIKWLRSKNSINVIELDKIRASKYLQKMNKRQPSINPQKATVVSSKRRFTEDMRREIKVKP